MRHLHLTLIVRCTRALADAGGAAGAGRGVRGPGAACAAARMVLASRPGCRGRCQRRVRRGGIIGCAPHVMRMLDDMGVTGSCAWPCASGAATQG